MVLSRTGHIVGTYTGALIEGLYARGHYGADFDAPWTWLPLGLLFLLPLALLRTRSSVPWLERDARDGRIWLDRLDLAMVLAFGVSYALFDTAHLESAVWTAYLPLLYLLGRMLRRGFRARAVPGRRLETRLPIGVLGAGVLVLMAFRVFLTLSAPMVMDVGGASAIGAYRILHGLSIYFPTQNHPDTYGPIAYLVYAPFQLIWPNANWYSFLPSVRAATISFDVATIAGLVWLGIRLRPGRPGVKLGLLLAWLWAACPFTALGLVKNTNDGLIAVFMVAILLALTAPAIRGVLLGLATAAKFFPALLLVLLAIGPEEPGRRAVRKVLAGFVIAAGVSVALWLPPGGLREMWDHTIGFQLTRTDIFSAWALHPALSPIKVAIEVATIALAGVLAVRPRGRRSPAQVAALSAALFIALQLTLLHWFYLYIVWFWPLVLVAVLAADGAPDEPPAPYAATVTPLAVAEPTLERPLVGAA